MNEKNNILNELKELNSHLSEMTVNNPYVVPEGYFDNLAQQVLNRVKATQVNDAKEELNILSPLIATISKEMPNKIPDGYFNQVENSISSIVQTNNIHQSAQEEIESISPLLSGLKKEMPYSIPEGYFENTSDLITKATVKPAAKIVAFARRSWFKYAAAAVITGIIVLSGFLIFDNKQPVEPGSKALAKFTKDVNKLDETQKDDLIDFIDAGITDDESAQTIASNEKEIKELLKGVSEKELLELNQQSEDLESVLMIN